MLGLKSRLLTQVFCYLKPITIAVHIRTLSFPCLPLKAQTPNTPKTRSSFTLFAQNGESNVRNEESRKGSVTEKLNGLVDGGWGDNDSNRDQRPLFNLKWGDFLYPDTDNFLAVGLTGLLTWASVQVLWQLLLTSLAILVAALKYSFIAALLIFILITLL